MSPLPRSVWHFAGFDSTSGLDVLLAVLLYPVPISASNQLPVRWYMETLTNLEERTHLGWQA